MRRPSSRARCWPAIAALAAVLPFAATAAAPSVTAGCAQPRDAKAFEAAFTEATVQRHSVSQLTCAATMSAAMAARSPADVDTQILAIDAQINLLEALQMQLDTQTYQGGTAFEEIKARWALGIRQGKAVSARLVKPAQSEPSIAAMRIAFELMSVSSSLVDPEQAYKVASGTVRPLAQLLEKNDKLLDGAGEMMMGRLYYQLPETAGGDLDQAVVHLGRAHEINRKSIVFQRWYAESLVAAGRKEQARQVLAGMLSLKAPEPIERQSRADELRAGVGLAQRAGDAALAERISAKREALLQEFPDLLTRQPAAILGHGGVDPLTGKRTD